MKMIESIYSKTLIFIVAILLVSSCGTQGPPEVASYSPEFGPPETLITVRGANFEDLIAINFNDVPANFNPSYGKEDALLFRVPEEAELGVNDILIKTSHGEITFPFRVTLEAPEVKDFSPKSAMPGDMIYITGENLFEPLEILFFDSIPGTVVYNQPDSIVVEVPENVQRGRIKDKANGGFATTKENFFTIEEILINDFDGNGLRHDVDQWLFYGNIDQGADDAVVNDGPSENYFKLSGEDPGSIWVGGTETNVGDAGFENFGILSDLNNTFIEMDASNGGQDKTHMIIILNEQDGFNDFTLTEHIDWEGWEELRIPINRFKDVNGAPIDASKIAKLKIHLYNELGSNQPLEINIDNLKFIQVN